MAAAAAPPDLLDALPTAGSAAKAIPAVAAALLRFGALHELGDDIVAGPSRLMKPCCHEVLGRKVLRLQRGRLATDFCVVCGWRSAGQSVGRAWEHAVFSAPIKDAAWRELYGKTLDDDVPCAVTNLIKEYRQAGNRVRPCTRPLSQHIIALARRGLAAARTWATFVGLAWADPPPEAPAAALPRPPVPCFDGAAAERLHVIAAVQCGLAFRQVSAAPWQRFFAVLSSGQYAAPGRNRVANIVSALSEEVGCAPLLDPHSGTPSQPPSPGPQCSDWPAIAQRLRSDCGALRPPLPPPVPCACPLPLAHCRVCAVRMHGALCAPPD